MYRCQCQAISILATKVLFAFSLYSRCSHKHYWNYYYPIRMGLSFLSSVWTLPFGPPKCGANNLILLCVKQIWINETLIKTKKQKTNNNKNSPQKIKITNEFIPFVHKPCQQCTDHVHEFYWIWFFLVNFHFSGAFCSLLLVFLKWKHKYCTRPNDPVYRLWLGFQIRYISHLTSETDYNLLRCHQKLTNYY